MHSESLFAGLQCGITNLTKIPQDPCVTTRLTGFYGYCASLHKISTIEAGTMSPRQVLFDWVDW